MAKKSEAVQKQLEEFKIDDQYEELKLRIKPVVDKLPKKLNEIAYCLFDFLTDDDDDDDDDDDVDEKDVSAKVEKEQKRKQDLLNQFDVASAADRKKIFGALAPALADSIEAAWQLQKTRPYDVGYSKRSFRAPKNAEATLVTRVSWINSFAREICSVKKEVLSLTWLARWSQHFFVYSSDVVSPLLIAAINKGGKEGDEVFDILYKTVTREEPIGIMGHHVIQTLLGSNRKDGWEIIEKTLLAAQRQEGLRQSILSNADAAHPEAFARLLRLILDKELIRFSSVTLAVNLWLGLLWDSISTKVLTENVEAILKYLDSESERKKALQSSDAESVYRALWVSAYIDAPATIAPAAKLLKHESADVRFVAAWMLTLIGLEPGAKAKLVAIDDQDLQVALMGAVGIDGISLKEDYDLEFIDDVSEKDLFERLERLYVRLPEKPQKLAARVWPWTERKIDRTLIADELLDALDKRPPTRMLPYLKGLDSWTQQSVIRLLAAQKKWDNLTRSTLFELAGDASSDVREAAFEALEKQTLQPAEYDIVEGYLTRKAADVRKCSLSMIMKGKDLEVLASAKRLMTKGDSNQRLAGLEILRQMCEIDRSRNECQKVAEEFRGSRKKLMKEEETQLRAIADSSRPTVSLNDGLGLLNPAGRSKVTQPTKKKVVGITKAAIACVKSLAELVHKHRSTIITTRRWKVEQKPLSEASYDLPSINLRKPLKPQLEKYPLYEVWKEWFNNRPASLKDKDGLEILRAYMVADLIDDWRLEELKKFIKKPDQKKIAVAVLGEFDLPKINLENIVSNILLMLFSSEIPKGCLDYLLDCTENSYAHVPDSMMQESIPKDQLKKKRHFWDDDEDDWRDEFVFKKWGDMTQQFLRMAEPKLTADQKRRIWQLNRFLDEPCPGASRRRMSLSEMSNAFNDKFSTFDDLVDCLIGPDRGRYSAFDELSNFTGRALNKQSQAILSRTKGLAELLDKIRNRVFEIELERGEAPTAATEPAAAIESLYGADYLFRAMAALNKDKFKVTSSWNSNQDTRASTLTHFIKVSFPTEKDTPDSFKRLVKEATANGYCSEDRLLELAFLAPQWSKLIGEALAWNGFSEGLYWFLAHMNTWYSDATEGAASAEGLEDDVDDDDDDDDDDEVMDDDSLPEQEKLSAWERLVLERTPLTSAERRDGAVDVAWFHRTWKVLGEKRWKQMAQAAKFAANAAQAKKAQFLADVLLGNKPRKELVDGIQKKFLKEYVRLLGLLPLEEGAKRDKDLIERYEVLQGYKKYARKLSSLTKPSALQAVDIGMNNLARLAGYADPLRMEWALEAESLKDLAKGPVEVTKDGITVSLSIDENSKPKLLVRRGDKPLKSIPSPLKKKHAAIAELADRSTELRKKASRTKQSLEAAMCRGDTISAAEVVQLFDHALVGPQLKRLVLVGEGIAGYPDKGGKVLRDHAGKLEPIKKNEQLKIAHPHDLLTIGDWDKWQQECFRAERVQPFKQIFRELYVITKQEKKDQDESHRFAGQQVGPRQAMALWNSREWNTQDGVMKVFHDRGLIAEVSFQHDYGTAAEVEGLTIETIRFRNRDDYKVLKLSSVPTSMFSEVMRDIDLVVSVAHRGEVDPEASASTVEMRAALIRETCLLLGLKNVRLKENHAIIKGYYCEYSLHLGSGGIHRMPGGALAVLPVHAQHRGRLFLPFADDDPRTAEVISKVLLLARDEEIQDPTILDQLGAPASKRPKIALTDTADKADAKAQQSKASSKTPAPVAGSLGGKRRFEFAEGKSSKFWEIELTGNAVTTSWGRIGSTGQSKTKKFADATKAKAEYDKLVNEKTTKGYVEK